MGRLHTWGAAARRSPRVLGRGRRRGRGPRRRWRRAGHPQHAPPRRPARRSSTRAVALGDSVPYGHGLANPYLDATGRAPRRARVSQGPSTLAYPSLVAAHLGLTMTVRPTNCRLTGDQLAISGAVADARRQHGTATGSAPCRRQQARNLGDEIAAADLAQHPARLVLLQDGADDIDFSRLPRVRTGPRPRRGPRPRDRLRRTTGRSRRSSPPTWPTCAPAWPAPSRTSRPTPSTVAVLDYYQPIPAPAQIADDTAASGLHTNLVCTRPQGQRGRRPPPRPRSSWPR